MSSKTEIETSAHKAVLDLRNDNRFRAVLAYVQLQYDDSVKKLVLAASEEVGNLQGAARAYAQILELEKRARQTVGRRTQAGA